MKLQFRNRIQVDASTWAEEKQVIEMPNEKAAYYIDNGLASEFKDTKEKVTDNKKLNNTAQKKG